MKLEKTNRGFAIGTFTDGHNEKCTIQKSSSVVDHIWLGIDKPKITVFQEGNHGQYVTTPIPEDWMISTRMHLNQEQVAALLPILQRFVETGEIE